MKWQVRHTFFAQLLPSTLTHPLALKPTRFRRHKKQAWYRKKKLLITQHYKHFTPLSRLKAVIFDYCYSPYRHKIITLAVSSNTTIITLPGTWGLTFGSNIGFFCRPTRLARFTSFCSLGDYTRFLKLSLAQYYHTVWLTSTMCVACAPGTFLRLLSAKQSGRFKVQFPSGRIKSFWYIHCAVIGRQNPGQLTQTLRRKAGLQILPRVRCKVRGIAKNPVDHPNGGNSNTKGSFKTPWGKIAKFGK